MPLKLDLLFLATQIVLLNGKSSTPENPPIKKTNQVRTETHHQPKKEYSKVTHMKQFQRRNVRRPK